MKNIIFFLAVFSPFSLPAQSFTLDATTTRTIVIGISDRLRLADRDVNAFANFMRSTAGGSLDD